ncbi:hypothetical protein KXD40_007895 [Peronospora effusa]|nr:hypothetical protein KXD40_007896 [Peronospora effusa]UIZ23331.1 hypothetical protein KXD40_007895 [Peronospora effusa]
MFAPSKGEYGQSVLDGTQPTAAKYTEQGNCDRIGLRQYHKKSIAFPALNGVQTYKPSRELGVALASEINTLISLYQTLNIYCMP